MNSRNLQECLHGASIRIHLIGVSGSGMSGIAALLLALGHQVSGSDKTETVETHRLARKGLHFSTPHHASQVQDAHIVIYSSAVKPGNPAYDEALRLQLPMYRRADALAAIMAGKQGIIVSGMHGKTTTSAMCAYAFRAAGLKPSHYVGAEIPILGTNARWDSDGEFFVAEGDESDGTLANYHPTHSIVLNVEPEHLDFYKNLEEIDAVYEKLLAQTSGYTVFCGDDPGAQRVTRKALHKVSYGEGENNDFRCLGLRIQDGRPWFRVRKHGEDLGEIHLGIPGKHNALNALAVIALSSKLDIPFAPIAEALTKFEGAKRRFETLYRDQDFWLVDDYGHHPTEIAATLNTARMTGAKRTVVLFQPHRYSRTQALQKEFGQAFKESEILAVTHIYAANETPIPGISGEVIVDNTIAMGHPHAIYDSHLPHLPATIGPLLEKGDLILSLGAGNIHEAGKALASNLAERRKLLDVMDGKGVIKLYEPLFKHTTMRIGGPAQFWVEPETETAFADLVRFCSDQDMPIFLIGRGSNLLVRDGGIHGVVIHLSRGDFQQHEIHGNEISAGVGIRFKQLSAIAKSASLSGFEWMEGIPGSLGGGLRMNAGAMGIQTFDQVVRVHFCDSDGNIFTRTPQELEIYYRNVPALSKNYALSATLRGTPASLESIEERMTTSETNRKASQPIAASAGCIFKNPSSIPAGKLIEELGLKGTSIGGACVSDVHANFIVNDGKATAKDVLALIAHIQTEAYSKCGIELETEVQIVGEE